MTRLLQGQTWRCRVAELLDDPVIQAVLRRDRLTRDDVLAQLAPIADRLRNGTLGATLPERGVRRDAA